MKIDVIGDIHGCYRELVELFGVLGYKQEQNIFIHSDDRIPIFLGDITDRGPNSLAVIELVYEMVIQRKIAKYVPGNHCNKLYRYFLGNRVEQKHGLETTVAELQKLSPKQQAKIAKKFKHLYQQAPIYLKIEQLHAVIAHAGIKEAYIGRLDKKVEKFVLYGDISGAFYPDGRPIRGDWALNYHGKDWIIYGHTPVQKPRIIGKTINIDTGCVFGGALTAFSLPEEKCFSIPSKQVYIEAKFTIFPV